MKQIKITKEQLDEILTSSNPYIIYEGYIHEGDIITCDENNSRYIVSEITKLGVLEYGLKDFVKINIPHVDLFNWEKQAKECFPDDIKFYKLSKLELILSSKSIDLNLLDHK